MPKSSDQPELGFTSSFDSLKGKLVWLKTEPRQAGDVIWTEIIDIAKPHALWSAALAAPIRLDFPTRAAAANLRHRLYRLRDVMRASQHEFAKQADLCKIAGVFPTRAIRIGTRPAPITSSSLMAITRSGLSWRGTEVSPRLTTTTTVCKSRAGHHRGSSRSNAAGGKNATGG